MSVLVTLTPRQVEDTRLVARSRLAAVKTKPKFGYETTGRSGLDTHHLGAMGELAFCLVVGADWPRRVNTFRNEPDVDPCWEVRYGRNDHVVKVATNDPADYVVAHVSGKPPALLVIGYVVAGWVQQRYPAEDKGARGNKAHFAPASVLAPINPDVHASHHYLRWRGEWRCLFCNEPWAE